MSFKDMENTKDEELLKKYKDQLRHPEMDFKKTANKITTTSLNLRRTTMQLIAKSLLSDLTNNQISHTLATPKCVVELTKLVRGLEKYQAQRLLQSKTKNEKDIKKLNLDIAKYHDTAKIFENDFKSFFELVETLMNSIYMPDSTIMSFNELVDNSYKTNILHFDELNILKVFNHVRNLYAHNSNRVLYMTLDRNDLLFYKAIILEARNVIMELALKYTDRIMFFAVYEHIKTKIIKNEAKKEDYKSLNDLINDILKQEEKLNIKKSISSLEGFEEIQRKINETL